mmetsp:Transcript_33345/g.81873  ORF Transcript_33345/g.81873 Transcript_33345/m.81873 type:complete len:303 (+) Transcript_33345:111-1019(+)
MHLMATQRLSLSAILTGWSSLLVTTMLANTRSVYGANPLSSNCFRSHVAMSFISSSIWERSLATSTCTNTCVVLEPVAEPREEMILGLGGAERHVVAHNVTELVKDGAFPTPLRPLQQDADARLLLRSLQDVGKVVQHEAADRIVTHDVADVLRVPIKGSSCNVVRDRRDPLRSKPRPRVEKIQIDRGLLLSDVGLLSHAIGRIKRQVRERLDVLVSEPPVHKLVPLDGEIDVITIIIMQVVVVASARDELVVVSVLQHPPHARLRDEIKRVALLRLHSVHEAVRRSELDKLLLHVRLDHLV